MWQRACRGTAISGAGDRELSVCLLVMGMFDFARNITRLLISDSFGRCKEKRIINIIQILRKLTYTTFKVCSDYPIVEQMDSAMVKVEEVREEELEGFTNFILGLLNASGQVQTPNTLILPLICILQV